MTSLLRRARLAVVGAAAALLGTTAACLPATAAAAAGSAPAMRSAPASAAALTSGRLFGLSSPGSDGGLATGLTSAKALGRHLDIVNFYSAWVWQTDFPVARLSAIAAKGATPEITWEPWDPRRGTKQTAYGLRQVASGTYDRYIKKWATQAKAYGRPVLIRFAHEMNLDVYPWAASRAGASTYVKAYRHVHDLFAAAGATNVKWIWSPNAIGGTKVALASVYPGAAYVDVVGVDAYNGGSAKPTWGGWHSPAALLQSTMTTLATVAPGKPVYLTEIGSAPNGGDKARWVRDLFAFVQAHPEIRAVIWFNFRPAGDPDWRLDTATTVRSAARGVLTTWR